MRRKLSIKPEDLDWSKKNYELSLEHDVSMSYLRYHRKRLAPDTVSKPIMERVDWTTVDWEKSNKVLAVELDCSTTTLSLVRKIHAPGTPSRIDWENIDWSQSTRVLMQQTGAPRQTVYKNRQQYAPETIHTRGSIPDDADWSLDDDELAIEHDVDPRSVHIARIRLGLLTPKPRQKSRWENVDWSQPSQQIADELGVSYNAVEYQRKMRGAAGVKTLTIWDRCDWEMDNVAIAKETGKTLGAVAYQRRKRFGPPTIQCKRGPKPKELEM